MSLPLVIVGASYREASTEVRAKLALLDPSPQLYEGGHITGAVRLQTCSRTEWVVSAPRADWAGELLKSALWSGLGERVPLHVKPGLAGAHYLMRVAAGLDAVAEGETAVGRQVLKAFERAHAQGRADKVLRLAWKHVESLVHARRSNASARSLTETQAGAGVEQLALTTLRSKGLRAGDEVAVLGRGDMGRTMVRALSAASFVAHGYGRAALDAFTARATRAPAVVVATAGPHAWLTLPARRDMPVCVDVGSPGQVRGATGWELVGLDALLSGPTARLSDEALDALEAQVRQVTETLCVALAERLPKEALMAIDEERREFLHRTLPGVLAEVPALQAQQVKKTVAAFTHTLLRRTRCAGRAR